MLVDELSILYKIQQEDTPCLVTLPGYDENNVYSIDLATRQIKAPKNFGVKTDHNASVIYFCIDRFYDYMDLTTLPCVIHYITANGEPHLYPVPFYDIYSDKKNKFQKIIIPWNISNLLTSSSGEVQYSFRFFKIEEKMVNGVLEKQLVYNLNTMPAKTKVLQSLDTITPEQDSIPSILPSDYEILAQKIEDTKVYWSILE